MAQEIRDFMTGRVLSELLKQTRAGGTGSLDNIAAHSRSSSEVVREVLDSLKIAHGDREVSLKKHDRLHAAMVACRAGSGTRAIAELDWREFELFVEEALREAGYVADRDVRFHYRGRSWQVDVVASKNDVLLSVDCKHWHTPMHPSRLDGAAEHQLTATQGLLQNLSQTRTPLRIGLPLILTVREPRDRVQKGVVLCSIGGLPSFLAEVFCHLDDLPFLQRAASGENPFKGRRN